MAFGRHPERTILVRLGYSRPFSDVAGRNEIRITNRSEDRQALAARLRTAGCAVKTENMSSWLSEGDFDSADGAPDHGNRGAPPQRGNRYQEMTRRIEGFKLELDSVKRSDSAAFAYCADLVKRMRLFFHENPDQLSSADNRSFYDEYLADASSPSPNYFSEDEARWLGFLSDGKRLLATRERLE